jgi:two-component system nitrate/nitrite response regulator NarL
MPADGEPVRVLVADDHPIYLDGICAAIGAADDLELLDRCGDGATALAQIIEHDPDVAVLDLKMPGMGALDLLQRLEAEAASTRVLVLSAYIEGAIVRELLEAGAGGCLAKDEPRDRVCEAIRAVARGETTLGQSAQTQIAQELRRRRGWSPLTDREAEILALLAEGRSAPAIADQLVLGTSTIKTHLRNIYAKLDVDDRAAAVAEAMRRGLLR